MSRIKEEIKKFFLKNPTRKIRVRQLERMLNLPLPSVIRYLKELCNENIIKEESISEVKFFTSNKDSKEFLAEKKIFNIKSLEKLTEHLISELGNPGIILFGSYSKGEDIESSDIDIFIETVSKKKLDLKEFEKYLERKIHIHTYPKISVINNKELANNIINGIKLNGYFEVFS